MGMIQRARGRARGTPAQVVRTWHGARTRARLSDMRAVGDQSPTLLADAFTRARDGESATRERWSAAIELERARLAGDHTPVVQGADPRTTGFHGDAERWTISDAVRSSVSREKGILLYEIVRALQPDTVLELGTSLGFSVAYMAAALTENGFGRLTTLDGSEHRIRIARGVHEAVGLESVTYHNGYFTETLGAALDELEHVDVAFIDGHHQLQPTLDYFDAIAGRMPRGAVAVFDDIAWSSGMKEAWRRLRALPHVTVAVTVLGMGVGVCAVDRAAPDALPALHYTIVL